MSADQRLEYVVQNEQMFGSALSSFRDHAGIRQVDLAERIGTHRTYLSGLENGKASPAMRTLMRAFRELDLEVVIRPVRR